jgi:hypothetical protein
MNKANLSLKDRAVKFDQLLDSGTLHALQEWLDHAHIPYRLGHLDEYERRLYEACKRACQESHMSYCEVLAWVHSPE